MGGILSTENEENSVLNSESYDLETLIKLKSNLGSMNLNTYDKDNRPEDLHKIFNKNAELTNNFGYFFLPEDNLDLLNKFLLDVSTFMRLKHGETGWESELFPKDSQGADLKVNNIELLKAPYSDNVLQPLRDRLGIDFVESRLKGVYRATSVYQFPEESLKIKLPYKKVDMSDCSIGSTEDEFTLYIDSEEHITDKLYNEWYLYEMVQPEEIEGDTNNTNEVDANEVDANEVDTNENETKLKERVVLHIHLGDGYGVELDESGNVIEYEDLRFNHLNDAISNCKNNNTRNMKSSLSKFQKWIKNNQGNDVYVRCGDVKEGELVSMTDFLERLKL